MRARPAPRLPREVAEAEVVEVEVEGSGRGEPAVEEKFVRESLCQRA